MYIPTYNRISDLSQIAEFIRNHPFALLITSANEQPLGSHIPLELETNEKGENILSGHISSANMQWKNFSNGETVMAVFQGPHSYVSSSWYNHINAPTWNYLAVHVYGKMKIIHGDELLNKLKTIVSRYESNSQKPFSIDQMPPEMIQKYLKGIVGFEMSMEKIEGKWKLSQNRDKDDFQNVIRELELLEDLNAKLIAEEMKKLPSK